MKNLIVVLMGGMSRERAISFLTGKACAKALKKKGYKVRVLDVKENFLDQLRKIKPNAIFNALHGRYGEDGFVQSLLEYIKIPYTHSGVISSSLAMDKEISKLIFKNNKINVPESYIIEKGYENNFNKKNKFPLVIKPTNEGSSLGVYICKNKNQFKKNLNKLKKKYDKILVEKYIGGKEIQVAVMGSKAIGAIELVPKRRFYDYKAKYSSKAKTKHIIPTTLTKIQNKKVLSLAKKAHKVLGCKGVTRSDFKFYKNKFYLLETNTQPGMTNLSLVPEIARYYGLSFENLVAWIIKDASINR